MNNTIDFETIRSLNPLGPYLASRLDSPDRSGKWLCPFHDDTRPSLHVTPDGLHVKCFACGFTEDVIGLTAKLDGTTVGEAARTLGGTPRSPRPGRSPRGRSSATTRTSTTSPGLRSAARGDDGLAAPTATLPRPTVKAAWRDPDWQRAVSNAVKACAANIWLDDAAPARAWLHARGLEDETIHRFRLGWNPRTAFLGRLPVLGRTREGKDRALVVARGITIPWVRPGSWYDGSGDGGPQWVGCNVRRLPEGDLNGPLPAGTAKYKALCGSEPGHCYPWSDVVSGVPALIVEGEFDALVAWQEAAAYVNVLTFGGASQKPRPDVLAALAECPVHLLAYDRDRAGHEAARTFADFSAGKDRRLRLPGNHNDLTDFHRAGGNIPAWLTAEFSRLGLPRPLPANSYPQTKPEANQ